MAQLFGKSISFSSGFRERNLRHTSFTHVLFQFLLCFLIAVISIIPMAQCQNHKDHKNFYTLDFSHSSLAPDGFVQQGISINGQLPGETLRFYTGETYEVQVINNLDHGLAIHFHGILQKGTVESDGVPYITQFPIPPKASYVYRMHTGNQSGTFMYHAHTGLDLVWAFGALIIEDPWKVEENPEYFYDRECVIFTSQIWHTPLSTITKGLEGKPFQDVPDTESILVQSPTCSLDTRNSLNRYSIIQVKPGLIYRFRVIGMGMDSMLTFRIGNHTLKIIEVDGILVDPVETNYLQLNSAQRYSILVKMDKPVGNYLMESEMIPGPGPTNGIAVLHYEGAEDPKELANVERTGETAEIEELSHWILDELHPSTKIHNPVVYSVPEHIDKEIIITSFQRDVDGYTKFDINNVVHKKPQVPLLHQVFNGTDITANKENGAYEILIGERVQIVFENRMSDEGECEQHPWHTHGHTFYIVGEGADSYDSKRDGERINNHVRNKKHHLLFRDVLTLYPNQTEVNNSSGAPCGWIAIRFVADNPGVWLVHCHITPHQIMGKEFVLYEREGNYVSSNSVSYTNFFNPDYSSSLPVHYSFAIFKALAFLYGLV